MRARCAHLAQVGDEGIEVERGARSCGGEARFTQHRGNADTHADARESDVVSPQDVVWGSRWPCASAHAACDIAVAASSRTFRSRTRVCSILCCAATMSVPFASSAVRRRRFSRSSLVTCGGARAHRWMRYRVGCVYRWPAYKVVIFCNMTLLHACFKIGARYHVIRIQIHFHATASSRHVSCCRVQRFWMLQTESVSKRPASM